MRLVVVPLRLPHLLVGVDYRGCRDGAIVVNHRRLNTNGMH